jgi:hypothetical protein
MKVKIIVALAVAVVASLAAVSLANAHYLCGCKAYKAAQSYAKGTAQRIADDAGATVYWDVKKPCSQRTAHRWVCDASFSWNEPGAGKQFCTVKVISQFASRTSYQVVTKGTGVNCN